MLDRRGGYEYEDLLACGRGEMFGPGNAQLPLPPMLMFDRISQISATGGEGRGRALGLGELKLSGQVMPNVRKIVYNVDIKRVMRLRLWLGIADGWLSADGEIIYRAKDLRVGLLKQDAASQPGT